jgi:hypothetical protein
MKQWRMMVIIIALAAALIMFVSALFGDLTWWSRPLVSRTMVQSPHRAWRLALVQDAGVRVNFAVLLAGLVTQLMTGVLVLYLVPRQVHNMAHAIAIGWRQLFRYFIVGILLAVVMAVVGLLSILALHTMPLLIILSMVFFLASLSGVVALTYQLGRGLLSQAGWSEGSPLTSLVLGTLVFYAITRIPFVGWVALVLLWLTGVGVAVATRFGSGKPWSILPLMED